MKKRDPNKNKKRTITMVTYTFKGAKRSEDGKYYDFTTTTTMTEVAAPTSTPTPEPTPTPTPTPEPTPTPAPTVGSAPLSYTDARFNSNVPSASMTLQRGATAQNKTITDTGSTASIIMMGGTFVKNCRIKSREGIRVADGGDFNISDTWIEVNGQGTDHADGLQAYSPGDRGRIFVRNTTFKTGTTAVNCAFFIADNWTGTIDFENVVFIGGPYGPRIHPDVGGDNIIRFKNVFLVPPFGWSPFLFSNVGGHKNIFEVWENVRMASISNGQLIPGNSIPRPS